MTKFLAILLLAVPILLSAGPATHAEGGVTTRSAHGISVTVSEPEGEDFPSNVSTPGGIIVGESASGIIIPHHDTDWYRVLLEQGRVYEITFERDELTSRDNAYLYNRVGAGIGHPNSYGDIIYDELVDRDVYLARYNGFHFIEIYDWNRGEYPSPYTFTVRDISHLWDPPDIGQSKGRRGTLKVNQSWLTGEEIPGVFDYNWDKDTFAMELKGGRRYQIDLLGEGSDSGTVHNPYILGVYDPKGKMIPGTFEEYNGRGLDAMTSFYARTSGTYTVLVQAYGTGTYAISLIDLSNAPSMIMMMTPPPDNDVPDEPPGGVIVNPDESKRIRTTLMRDRVYHIGVEGVDTDSGTLTDPVLLGLYDKLGNPIYADRVPGHLDTYDNDSGIGRNSLILFQGAGHRQLPRGCRRQRRRHRLLHRAGHGHHGYLHVRSRGHRVRALGFAT